MKIRRILAILLFAATVITLVSCNRTGANYSDDNAYVSVYVYDKDGKAKLSVDAVRVAPQEDVELEGETRTDEEARQLYRLKPTGLAALELAAVQKDKNAVKPNILVAKTADGYDYTLDSVNNISAGRSGYDIYVWKFYINGVESDYVKSEIKNFDLLEFRLQEQTNRTFNVTFTVTKDGEVLVNENEYSVAGEKSDMTIANYLKAQFLDRNDEPDGVVAEDMKIVLSEDGKRVIKIGELEENEEEGKIWVCYIHEFDDDFENDVLVEEDLDTAMITESAIIRFDYVTLDLNGDGEQTADAEAEETQE